MLQRKGILSVDFTLLGDCPTEEGEALVYDMEIPIENFFPTIEILGRLSHMLHCLVRIISYLFTSTIQN